MPVNIGNLAKEYCSLDRWRKRLPITLWLPRYKLAFVIRDVIAGLTVAITVIPQGMAYASIAKLSIEYGLYSSFMCCFVYVLLGTTRDMAIGPTSVMSLLVSSYGQVSAVNPDHNDHVYAVILAFFVGIVQFAIGLFHLGSLTSFISTAVVSSFTSASAIIVIVDQLRVILGLTFESSSFIQNFVETLVNIPKTRPWDLLLGSVCMIVLLLLQALKDQILRWEMDETYEPHRLQRYIWNLLWLVGIARYAIIILFSGVTAWILEETGKSDYITLTGPITNGLPPFAVPAFNTPDWFEVLNTAIILVPIIGFVESIATARSFGRKNNYQIDANQEFIASGLANLAGSFVSAYPVAGSFSRSAIMAQCGARTPLANLVTGSIVLLAIAFLTPAFYFIPKAALAAVIISALLKLVDPAAVKTFWRVRKLDLIPYTFTFVGSLVLGLQYGVVIGVALDLVILIYPVARPNIEFVKPSLLTAGIECSSSKSDNPAMVVRVQGSMRYPSSRYIVDSITKQCLHGDFCRPVILDFTFAKEMDTTAIEDLYDILDTFKKENVRIVMACVKDNIKCQLVAAEIPGLTVFTTIEDARLGLQEMETESNA